MVQFLFILILLCLANSDDNDTTTYPWLNGQWHKYDATMKSQHSDFAAFFVNDILFAIGGEQARNTSEYVDTSSKDPSFKQTKGVDFDFESTSGGSSIVYNDDMVFLGCDEYDGQLRLYDFSNTTSPEMASMNISSIPVPVTSCCMRLNNDKIYVTGGQYNDKGQPLLQIYDIENDEWSMGANMTLGRMFHGCEIMDDDATLYVFMGDTSSYANNTRTNEMYNMMTDKWMSLDAELDAGRDGFYARRLPETSWIILNGGYAYNPNDPLDFDNYQKIVVFDTETNEFLDEDTFPQLQCNRYERSVTIIQEYDEMGVNGTMKARIWNIGGSWEYGLSDLYGQSIYYMDYPCSEFDDCLDEQPECDSLEEIIRKLARAIIIGLIVGGAIICIALFGICICCAQRKRKPAPDTQYQMFQDDTKFAV